MRALHTQVEGIREEFEYLKKQIDELITKVYDSKIDPEKMKELMDSISVITKKILTNQSKNPYLNKWITCMQSTKRSLVAHNNQEQPDVNELTQLRDSFLPQMEQLILSLEKAAILDLSIDCLVSSTSTIITEELEDDDKAVRLTKIKDYLDYVALQKGDETAQKTSKTIDLSRGKYPECELDYIDIVIEPSVYHTLTTQLAEIGITLATTSESIKKTAETADKRTRPESKVEYEMALASSALDNKNIYPMELDKRISAVKDATDTLPTEPYTTSARLKLEDTRDTFERFTPVTELALNKHICYKLKAIASSLSLLIEGYTQGKISKEEINAYLDTFIDLTLELVSTLENPHSYVVELKDAIVSGCGDIKDKVVKKGPKVD